MDLDKYFKDILEDIKQNKIVKPKVNKLMKKEERQLLWKDSKKLLKKITHMY